MTPDLQHPTTRQRGGSSIVAVLVVALLGALVAAGFSVVQKNATDARRLAVASTYVGELKQRLRAVIGDQASCASSLQGLDAASAAPQAVVLKNAAGDAVFKVGDTSLGVKVTAVTATMLQTTGDVREVSVKVAYGGLANGAVDRSVNVAVPGSAVTDCLLVEGAIDHNGLFTSQLKSGYDGAKLVHATTDSDAADGADPMQWVFKRNLKASCALSQANREYGCFPMAFNPINVTATGSYLFFSPFGTVGVYNSDDTPLTVVVSIKITCGTVVKRQVVAATTGNNGNNLGATGASSGVGVAVRPGDTCVVQPYLGWSWAVASPTNATATVRMSTWALSLSVVHYR